ncbi:MAG: T9SS type A sorting domain-containing protein, partial [Saprospiraceae bacterium]|nr:T9SS type A sorting domain-containing protein [Saprospiraceae bacterium]
YSNIDFYAARTPEYIEANNPNLPDALNYRESSRSFQFVIIPTEFYEAVDENGYRSYGYSSVTVTYPIQALTGGPNDSLSFPGKDAIDNGRLDYLQFPCQYGSAWTQSSTDDIDFVLTVQGFGLDHVPGFQRIIKTQTREVVGEGTLTMAYADGTPTKPINALLLKVVSSTVDSFYLAGSVAPPALAAAFGLSQGNTTRDSFYIFYAENFGRPVMDYDMVAKTIAYRPYADQSVSSTGSVFSGVQLNIFPNPVEKGNAFTIHLNEEVSQGQLQIIDLLGKAVYQQKLENTFGNHSVMLPSNITAGTYVVRLIDDAGRASQPQKIHVH